MDLRRVIPFLILVVGIGFFFYLDDQRKVEQTSTHEVVISFENGTTIFADLADTNAERSQGLSGRETLGENQGLLFIHDELVTPGYWMPNMNFSIDIIWLVDEEIVGFAENAIPEDPAETIYSPDTPINQVLEVNAGFVEENSLIVGEMLDIERVEE